MYILGLDIGGTKSTAVLGDRRGTIHLKAEWPTCPQRGFFTTFAEICRQAEQLRDSAVAAGMAPEAVSVAIGGPLDIERGIVCSPPNLPGWDNIPLKELLWQRLGLPVYVEHDGNAGALAEWYFGAARGARNVVFITMGTGFGAGLIVNGQLYRGTCDLAGEIGHVRLAERGPVGYGKVGSCEAFCGGAGIAQLAALRRPERWGGRPPDARELGELAASGDADALSVLEEVASRLGQALAILVDILNPQIIVLGSLAVRLGELLLKPALEELARQALPQAVRACRVVPAELGERLGQVASLCAAIAAAGGPEDA